VYAYLVESYVDEQALDFDNKCSTDGTILVDDDLGGLVRIVQVSDERV